MVDAEALEKREEQEDVEVRVDKVEGRRKNEEEQVEEDSEK